MTMGRELQTSEAQIGAAIRKSRELHAEISAALKYFTCRRQDCFGCDECDPDVVAEESACVAVRTQIRLNLATGEIEVEGTEEFVDRYMEKVLTPCKHIV